MFTGTLRFEFDAADRAAADAFADRLIAGAYAAGATVVDEVHHVAA